MRPQFNKLPCHSAGALEEVGLAKTLHVRRIKEQEHKESVSSSDIGGHRNRATEVSPASSTEKTRKGSFNVLLNSNELVGTKMTIQRFRALEKEAEEDSRFGSSQEVQLSVGEKNRSNSPSLKRSSFASPDHSLSPKKNVSFSPNLIMFVYKKD